MNKKFSQTISSCLMKRKNFQQNIILKTLFIFIFITSTSCISILERHNARTPTSKGIYPGASESFKYILGAPFIAVLAGQAELLLLSPIALVDLPFTFALDTLLLPTDLLFAPGSFISKHDWTRFKLLPVMVLVVDEEGFPVSGVGVRTSSHYKWIYTDPKGIVETKRNSFKNDHIFIKKSGYYDFYVNYSNYNLFKQQNAEDKGEIDLLKIVLQRIINPVPMLNKNINLPIPILDEPVGFDFEVGDWSAPHGNGIKEDMLVTVLNNHDMTIDFPNPNDGMQPSEEKQGIRLRQAPNVGYSVHNVIYRKNPNVLNGEGFTHPNYFSANWIFRCRTQINNDDGQILSVNYGYIEKFSFHSTIMRISLRYYYNPDPQSHSLEPKEIADRQGK